MRDAQFFPVGYLVSPMHDMKTLVRRIRDDLLSTGDTVCLQRARLVTDAYQQFDGEPTPIKRAKTLAHVLRHMDLDVASNPFFAGNTSSRPRAWVLFPERTLCFGMSQMVIENECLRNFLDGKIPKDLLEFWEGRQVRGGPGHLAIDLDMVVHRGLESIIEEIASYADDDDAERRAYREGMAIALQAVVDWALRYAEEADAAARNAADPVARDAHLRVAEACRRVPAKPARNLFEGLQAIALVHLAIHLEGHSVSA